MNLTNNTSLRIKLILPLLILFICSAGALYLQILPSVKKTLNQEFISSEKSILTAISVAAVNLLLAGDLNSLHVLLEEQQKLNPQWKALRLYAPDPKGILIYPLKPEPFTEAPHIIALSHIIKIDDTQLGVLKINTDSTNAVYKKIQSIEIIGNIGLALLTLIIAAVSWIQDRVVSRPIRLLASAVDKYRNGAKEINLKYASNDEVGQLTSSFSNMVDTIETYQSSLINEMTRTHTLMNNIFDAIITSDSAGCILTANKAAESMFGYSKEELTGQPIGILMAGNDAQTHNTYVQNYVSTNLPTVIGKERETTAKRKDGSEFPVELAVSDVTIDDSHYFIGIIRDMSIRKRYEESILLQKQQIETINQAQTNFILSHNPVELFTGLLPDILDLSNSEYGLIGEVIDDRNNPPFIKLYAIISTVWNQEKLARYGEQIEQGMEVHDLDNLLGEVITGSEIILENDPDSSYRNRDFPLDHPTLNTFLGLPLFMGDRVVGILALANRPEGYQREVTGLLQPITATCAHLIDAVGKERQRKQAETELRSAKLDAEAATIAKSSFLATMSHEIRTPMNGVLGMLQVLQKTNLNSAQSRYLEIAAGSGEMLLTVINDILDFSKIEAEQLQLESIPFNPALVAEETVTLLSKTANEKSLELVCHINPELPYMVRGDPTRLRQILTNLINNAIKFTHQGEVSLYIYSVDDELRFSVKDTGIGMTERQKDKLFKAFSQVDDSHTRKYGGTGLGLAISQRLIEAMGGEISVKSEPGTGSEFNFSIPLKIVHTTPPAAEKLNALRHKRVLLVDENETSLVVLSNMLIHWGVIRVALARNAEDALEYLDSAVTENAPYDVAVIDTRMSTTDGIGLLDSIHQKSNLADLFIIALGSLDEMPNSRRAHTWTHKPVRQSDLYNCLIASINNSDNRKSNNADYGTGEDFCFENYKLLLVEDNAINQMVAHELLQAVGFSIEIAENGEQALEAVQNHDFDIVLMDIQMPVMDGLEATKKIRQLGEKYLDLPIIAMTAHALGNDRDRSLLAGMNAHIDKPVDASQLLAELARWITPIKKASPSPRSPDGYQNPAFPSLEGINTVEGLHRMNGNQDSYKNVLINFHDKYIDLFGDMVMHVRIQEWKQAEVIAHGLKGSSGNIGAKSLYELASRMEIACRQHDIEASSNLLPDLVKHAQIVFSALEPLTKEAMPRSGTNQNMSEQDATIMLDEVITLLDSDIAEAKSLLEKISHSVTPRSWKHNLDSAIEAFRIFDIDSARNALLEIGKTEKVTKNFTEIRIGRA